MAALLEAEDYIVAFPPAGSLVVDLVAITRSGLSFTIQVKATAKPRRDPAMGPGTDPESKPLANFLFVVVHVTPGRLVTMEDVFVSTREETRAGLVPWGREGLKVCMATACASTAQGRAGIAKLPGARD